MLVKSDEDASNGNENLILDGPGASLCSYTHELLSVTERRKSHKPTKGLKFGLFDISTGAVVAGIACELLHRE